MMGYLEQMSLDSASAFFQIAKLAVLGANDTNTEDAAAIDAEAEAIADEFDEYIDLQGQGRFCGYNLK